MQHLFAWVAVAGLVVLGIAWRINIAGQLPLINDEQAFAYDAVLFQVKSPLFWKSPLLVVMERVGLEIAGWQMLVSIRWPVILSAVAGLGLLSWCAKQMAGKAAGWATLIVGMVFAPALAHTVPAISEHVMLLPIGLLLSAIILARRKERIPAPWLVGISMLLGLVVLARWSGIFWFLPTIGLLATASREEMIRRVVWLVLPFVLAGFVFLLVAPGVVYGFDVKGEFLRFFEDSAKRGWIVKWLAWVKPLARFLPFWLLGLVALWGQGRFRQMLVWVLLAVISGTLLPVLFSGERMPVYELGQWLGVTLFVLIVGASTIFSRQHNSRTIAEAVLLFLPPLIAYIIFSKVNEKYLAEFLPGAVMLAGLGLSRIFEMTQSKQWVLGWLSLVMLAGWLTPWYPYMNNEPYAGTLTLSAVYEAVSYLTREAEADDKIVTGAVFIPLLAGHEPAFAIPHPAWIYPTFRNKVNPRFEPTYGPVADALEKREIDFFIEEKLTTDTYRNHPRVGEALDKRYEVVAEFDNEGSAPIQILRPR